MDERIGNLRVPQTWKGVLFVGRAFGHGAVQEMKDWPFVAALRWEAANHHTLRWPKTVVVSDVEKAREMRQVTTTSSPGRHCADSVCGRSKVSAVMLRPKITSSGSALSRSLSA